MPLSKITNPFLDAAGSASSNVYSPAANTVAISTAGSERVRVDSSGNMGIGTSSPSYKLDVQGTTANQRISSTTGTNAAYQIFSNTGQNFYVGLDNSAGNQILSAAYGATLLGSGAYPMVFGTNNAERMRIDSSGRVTTPYQTMFTARNSYSYNIASGTPQLVTLNDYFVNIGSCYNNSTMRFTAPVAGQYQLTITGMLNTGQSSTGNASIRLRKNGSEFTYSHINGVHPASACVTLIVTAAANDYFEYWAENIYIQGASNYITTFSGFLVG